jgi:hypothetical protein
MDKDSNDPTSPDALEDFLDGLEEKIGPDFGTISSREEMREVKTEIAREMGVAEEYHPNVLEAINEHGDDGREAYEAVEERYEEHLLRSGTGCWTNTTGARLISLSRSKTPSDGDGERGEAGTGMTLCLGGRMCLSFPPFFSRFLHGR